MTNPKEIEQLKKLLSKQAEENKKLVRMNSALKRENKKMRDLFVKIQGQVMRLLNGE